MTGKTAEQQVRALCTAIKASIEAKGFVEYNHTKVAEQEAWKEFQHYIAQRVKR